jgi:hypothetical protein
MFQLPERSDYNVSAPDDNETEFYEWFKANPTATRRKIIKALLEIHKDSFLQSTLPVHLKELLSIDMSHCVYQDFQKAEAIYRLMRGDELSYSMGICESTTQGFGRICSNGYWEFPIGEVDLKRMNEDPDWCLRKGK